MTSEDNREAWTEILESYKNFRLLWDKSDKNYGHKVLRSNAFKVLTQMYKDKVNADASVHTLKRKLINMRTTYHRELKKVKASELETPDDVYVPALWYYNHLTFLGNMDVSTSSSIRRSRSPLVKSEYSLERSSSYDPLDEKSMSDSNSNNENEIFLLEISKSEQDSKKRECQKKQKVIPKKKPEPVDNQNQVTMKEEEWEVMGKSIGLQLREISKTQLTIVSKIISDAIYFGKLNKLSEASHIAVGNSSSPHCGTSHYKDYHVRSNACAACGRAGVDN